VCIPVITDDLRAGLAFSILQIAVYIEYGIDNVLISAYGGAADVVQYDLISRLFNYIPAFAGLVTFPLWPALRSALTSGEARTANLLYRATIVFVFLASSTLSAIFFSLHQPMIKAWTGVALAPDAPLVGCIAAFSVATSVVAVQTAALNAMGFLKAQIVFLIWSCPILLAAKVAGLAAGYLFIVPASTLVLFVIKFVVFRRALAEAWSS
jgi:O-antigen/teichoic acid export membrane protein